MRRFGLELRKVGSMPALYDDVEKVLKNYNIPSKSVNYEVQVQAVAHSLQKMLKPDSCMNICDIKECAKVCSVCISSERLEIYHTAHCMYWNEMTEDYRNMLMAMVLDDFSEVLNPKPSSEIVI